MDTINLKEVCKILSITTATGRNWLKSGRIIAVNSTNEPPLFSKQDIDNLLDNIKNNKLNKLKSRRNKKHVLGVYVPKGYIDDNDSFKIVCKIIEEVEKFNLPEGYERFILAEYSKKLLTDVGVDNYSRLIDDLLDNKEYNLELIKPALDFDISFAYGQDFLGLLYMSLQTLESRKSTGVYYTPINVVRNAIENLHIKSSTTTIIDPCCGTGNFLINVYLHNKIMIENIYGIDIDPVSIMLTRINMLLVSKTNNVEILYNNFVCQDSLLANFNAKYDVIVGNPPWGVDFNEEKTGKLKELYYSTNAKNVESFCVFVEKAINICNEEGEVCFILPEAILNVKNHRLVREYIVNNCKIKSIKFWGNAFNGVYTPSITLTMVKKSNTFTTKGITIINEKEKFLINTERSFNNFNFNLTDSQYEIIQKIENKSSIYLKDKADFALGIVTGDNSKFIQSELTPNSEIILKGSDIYKYNFKPSNNYIEFRPNEFQQVANVQIYRAEEKLIYRFICESLVFSYDNSQTLTLNSANILIPKIKGYSAKYILAILNSRIAQFYFMLKFNSIKVLRQHIESIPIPMVDILTQQNIINKVDDILTCNDSQNIKLLYEDIDKIIMNLYNLDDLEVDEILKTIKNCNQFI